TWGGTKDDYGLGVSSDSAGNVYCSGYFWSSAVDFDPGPETEIFTSHGWWDAFLSKLDSDGNFEWAGAWGGTYQDDAAGVSVDEYDDVYVTGRFYYTVDFDPDPIDVAERTAVLSADAYLSKFTPDGDLQWVFAWGGQTLDKCLEVETNKSGKVNVAGEVLGRNMIKNFDLDGNEVWIADWYQNANILGLDVSAEGNSFCSGQYKSPSYVDFDPGDGEWYSDNFAGGVDSFIIKVLPNGLWY
ncbi:hypothetical protein KKB99_07070, partial [bacterium]|nr:hypothetical protein [bacterium]MBU1025752.1 hypothetical protein [bacterium]